MLINDLKLTVDQKKLGVDYLDTEKPLMSIYRHRLTILGLRILGKRSLRDVLKREVIKSS